MSTTAAVIATWDNWNVTSGSLAADEADLNGDGIVNFLDISPFIISLAS